MIAIDKILADVLPKGERVLIFSVSDKDSTVQLATKFQSP
jgi:hypothetical protein